MYKLLVVDDEFHIRDGISHVIPWEDYGISVVGEASDGLEALGLIEMLKPDIVITDIEMEPMNGLELAEMIKRDYPNIKTVILTGYDEFEYARKAVALKVCSYVLKPVLPDELVKVIIDIISDLDEQTRMYQQLVENEEHWRDKILSQLLDDSQSQDKDNAHLFKASYCTCLLFSVDDNEVESVEEADSFMELSASIKKEIENALPPFCEIIAQIHRYKEIILIVGNYECTLESFQNDFREKAEQIKHFLCKMTNKKVNFGIGKNYSKILDIGNSMSEAKIDLKCNQATKEDPNHSSHTYKTVIIKAREYIANHYTNPDISLESIASYLYLTPAYFSKLYKEETGETYIQFLTELRIQDAKSQLMETNKKVVAICVSVGYRNAQYFSTLFKKVVGVTPAEYRSGFGGMSIDD